MDVIEETRPFKTRDWPVLRVEEGGFQVLGGFRFELEKGFTLDWLGWRLMVIWLGVKNCRFRGPLNFWDEPPRLIWWILGPIDIHFSPAYSGMLVPEEVEHMTKKIVRPKYENKHEEMLAQEREHAMDLQDANERLERAVRTIGSVSATLAERLGELLNPNK